MLADLYAVSKKLKGDRVIYDTGVAMTIPEGYMDDYFRKVKTKLSVAISKALNREGETIND